MAAEFTPERITDVAAASDPQLSPDGQRIAFTRARSHRRNKRFPTEVWLVAAAGGTPPRRFTASPRCDERPRWSPDGHWLAFLSDREVEDERRLHVMPSGPGEARQLGDLPGDVTDLRWRPDSQAIGFLRQDLPPEQAPGSAAANDDDAVVTERDDPFTRLWLVSLAGGAPQVVSPPGLQVWAFDFAPDGNQAVLVCSPGPSLDDQMLQNDLMLLELASGATRRLCPTRGAVNSPRWSPDGRWIAFCAGDGAEYLGSGVRVCPASGGEPRRLLEQFEGDANWLEWLPDGRLAVAAFSGLDTTLLAVAPEGGAAAPLLRGEPFVIGPPPLTFSVDRAGIRLATTIEQPGRPREIALGELGDTLRPLTTIGDAVAALDHGEVRRLSWPAADGLRIDGLLYLPPGYVGGRLPFVLQVHGGPAGHFRAGFLAGATQWAALLAANGYAVLLANPRGSGGRGRDFVRANFRDWGGGDFRDLMAGVEHAIALGIADPGRLGVGGWSYGGYLTAWTIGHTDRFKAAVVGAAITNLLSFQGTTDIARGFLPLHYTGQDPYRQPDFWRERSPLEYVTKVTTPSLILCGEDDKRVPIGQSWEFYRALRALDVETQFVRYPREEHTPHERAHQIDIQRRVLSWFDRFLKDT